MAQLQILITDVEGKETKYDNVQHVTVKPLIFERRTTHYASVKQPRIYVTIDFEDGSQSERYGSEFALIHA